MKKEFVSTFSNIYMKLFLKTKFLSSNFIASVRLKFNGSNRFFLYFFLIDDNYFVCQLLAVVS